MEGRAIARPNDVSTIIDTIEDCELQWRAGQLPGQTRENAFPVGRDVLASMEGRAIARPNDVEVVDHRREVEVASMEGRAIARPNLECLELDSLTLLQASMEGRAIARPNVMSGHVARPAAQYSFNGGPGNCLAKRRSRR